MPGGRPSKYSRIDLKQVERLAGLGLNDEEIGISLDVVESTINEYKKKYPEFSESVKRGKLVADERMVESCYKRGLGFEHDAIELFVIDKQIVEYPIKKYFPPEPSAIFFWLQNRRRQDWRDRRGEAAGGQGTVNIIFEKPK